MPAMPEGRRRGILKGLLQAQAGREIKAQRSRQEIAPVRLCVILRRDACERQDNSGGKVSASPPTSGAPRATRSFGGRPWPANAGIGLLQPPTPRQSYVQSTLEHEQGPFVAGERLHEVASGNDQPAGFPGGLSVLGTDGFGRSDDRSALRRHFEVDAECIAIAASIDCRAAGPSNPRTSSASKSRNWVMDPDKVDPVRDP